MPVSILTDIERSPGCPRRPTDGLATDAPNGNPELRFRARHNAPDTHDCSAARSAHFDPDAAPRTRVTNPGVPDECLTLDDVIQNVRTGERVDFLLETPELLRMDGRLRSKVVRRRGGGRVAAELRR